MWQRADGQWQTGTNGSLTFFGLTAGQTYTIYARYEAIASGDSPAFVSGESSTQAATKASTGQAPTVTGIIVTDTTIKLPDNAAWEYSTDGQTWNSAHEFTGLTPATQYTYYIREKETDDTEASEIATVTVYTAYAAPAAGTGYIIDYEEETLTIDSGYEVNTAEDFGGTGIASGGSLADCIGQTLYIRHTADADGAPASAAVELPISARPAAPGVTGGILNISGADTTMEYSTDQGAAWTAFIAETVSGINAGTYLVRYAAVAGDRFASESAEVTVTRPSSGSSGGGSSSEGSYTGPVGVYYADGRNDLIPSDAAEGTWEQETASDGSIGWRFKLTDGSYAAGRWIKTLWNDQYFWYHFNAKGYLDSGWFTDTDGNIYYLHPLHDGNFGYMYTGGHVIDGIAYGFSRGREQDGLLEEAMKR